MNFSDLIKRAKTGDNNATEEILKKYEPLLWKNAVVQGEYDEDLYQRLCSVTLSCIQHFKA